MMSKSAADANTERGLRTDHVTGIAFVVLALLIGWENRVYPLGSLSDPGPGYLPLMLAAGLGVLGVLIALRAKSSALFDTLNWTEARRGTVMLVACGLAVFVLERIGYRLTMIVLLWFMLGVVERKRLLPTLSVACGFAFISYYLFATLLKVQLPTGLWGL